MGIRQKMLLPMIAMTTAAIIAVLITVIIVFSGYVDDSIGGEINVFSGILNEQVNDLKSQAEATSASFAGNDDLAQVISTGNRKEIQTMAAALLDECEMDFCTITDPKGVVLLRSHEPANYGDNVSSQSTVSAAMAGKSTTTVETGSAVRLAIRSGSPVYHEGELVGVVSTGFRLDTMDFVDEMKSLMGAEVTVFLGDERLSTTVVNPDGTRAVGTKASDTVISQVLDKGLPYEGKAQILGREAFVKYLPMQGEDGGVLGMLFVGQYTDVKDEVVKDFILRSLIVAVILMLVAIPMGLFVSGRTVKPIHALVSAAENLAAGDVDVNIQVNTKDEMKQLAEAFGKIIAANREQAHIIKTIADGDLSIHVRARSSKDVVGQALETMLQMNNDVYHQIIDAASQVSLGSSQVAQGAQELAQNNTEQTASVEQLSTAISEIAEKTRMSAEMASQAASLGETIREKAEQGSAQMDRMMEAVREINDASQNISRVIKVIDDIAFQTNILALNAAVEAARAGQHGKGFAVVADEVRNLAGKSAEAAKDTGALIENSMEKANLGTTIAEETARFLEEIVQGISESTTMVDEISEYSSQQSGAIDSINSSVMQVAQVVQATSALSEETAASSEEMSSQAQMLTQLVGRFKLQS